MVILAVALYLLSDVLLILFLALVISSALDVPISFLERRRIPRILGAILFFLLIAVIIILLLYSIAPVAFFEFKSFFEAFSNNQFKLPVNNLFKSSYFVKGIEGTFKNFFDIFTSGSASFFDIVSVVFGSIIFTITVLILSFYLAVSKYGVEKFLRAVLPTIEENYVISVYLRTRHKIGLWLQGQMILSLIVAIIVFLGLFILGVKYSLVLGILAGLLEIVPFVGPVFVGTLAFLVAISDSWTLGISVIIFFVIVQQIENHLLMPLVMRYATGLHPIIVVISLLAGIQIAGLVGIILAVPAAVVIQEIIDDWANWKQSIREQSLIG